jgi:hypothetical protein
MKKKEKKVQAPSRPAAGRKVTLKDLKAKDAGSVKGGGASVAGEFDISKRH